jgi:hypothetical protein
LKGILGIGGLWAAAGGVVGIVAGAALAITNGIPLLPMVWAVAFQSAGIGFVLGCSFATIFTVLEGRRRFDQLSTARAALWGFLAGAGAVGAWTSMVLATISGPGAAGLASINIPAIVGGAMVSYGTMSAALASGTVALAKRAPEALEAGVGGGREALSSGDE